MKQLSFILSLLVFIPFFSFATQGPKEGDQLFHQHYTWQETANTSPFSHFIEQKENDYRFETSQIVVNDSHRRRANYLQRYLLPTEKPKADFGHLDDALGVQLQTKDETSHCQITRLQLYRFKLF